MSNCISEAELAAERQKASSQAEASRLAYLRIVKSDLQRDRQQIQGMYNYGAAESDKRAGWNRVYSRDFWGRETAYSKRKREESRVLYVNGTYVRDLAYQFLVALDKQIREIPV